MAVTAMPGDFHTAVQNAINLGLWSGPVTWEQALQVAQRRVDSAIRAMDMAQDPDAYNAAQRDYYRALDRLASLQASPQYYNPDLVEFIEGQSLADVFPGYDQAMADLFGVTGSQYQPGAQASMDMLGSRTPWRSTGGEGYRPPGNNAQGYEDAMRYRRAMRHAHDLYGRQTGSVSRYNPQTGKYETAPVFGFDLGDTTRAWSQLGMAPPGQPDAGSTRRTRTTARGPFGTPRTGQPAAPRRDPLDDLLGLSGTMQLLQELGLNHLNPGMPQPQPTGSGPFNLVDQLLGGR